MLSHYLWKVKVQICGKLRTRWTFRRAVMVSVGISKLGLRDLIFVHPGVKINGSYYQVITFSRVVRFLGQCSFVDQIKLNYSLANTTLQYVRAAISGCVQYQYKCLLVNYSGTTSSSVFSHHTHIRPVGVRPNPTNPLWIRRCDGPTLSQYS